MFDFLHNVSLLFCSANYHIYWLSQSLQMLKQDSWSHDNWHFVRKCIWRHRFAFDVRGCVWDWISVTLSCLCRLSCSVHSSNPDFHPSTGDDVMSLCIELWGWYTVKIVLFVCWFLNNLTCIEVHTQMHPVSHMNTHDSVLKHTLIFRFKSTWRFYHSNKHIWLFDLCLC